MADLLIPVDHAGAYDWTVVALAHLALGMALQLLAAAALSRIAAGWVDGIGGPALALVVGGYALAWEGLAQRLGAGLPDALLDTAMVAAGAALALLLWRRQAGRLALVLTAVAAVIANGIRRRG
jgi:hypothetical protein